MAEISPLILTDLAQSERFRLLVAAVKDYAIYLLDAGGHVATWNPGAQIFKGYTADEIIGRHFSVFYTDEDRALGRPARALETALSEGRFEAEGWRVRKDGTQFWTHIIIDPVLDEQGRLIGFAKITRDISDKRRIDEALHESERRFRFLVQGVRDYAIYMLDVGGHISNWNAGAEAIKGYSADEVVGQHFSLFYTQEDRERGEPARTLATALREGKFEGEARRVRKGGEIFWAHVLIDPIYDDTGTHIGFAKVTRDVTERRRTQEEIERTRESLIQAQKMEAIGRLTGGVAHDFNNLLTVIRASADFLRRPGLSEDKRARYVDAIAETADRAAALTGQLLAFARRQPLRPETFDATTQLQGLADLFGTTVGASIAVEIQLQTTPRLINADASQFETAILNLVINARDAMGPAGRILITADEVTDIPAIRGHAPATGQFIAIRVADTGSGIAPDILPRIFEPFFTTKAVDKGTGLGLSQVYGFAKQSGGEIDVASEPGVGTTFTIYLPRAFGQITPAATAHPAHRAALPTRSILLVEDNESVGRFASDLLVELGQAVTWAGDARSALDILRARPGDFDVVFTDVVMPGMSGIELAHQIRTTLPDLEVILTSGYSHVLAEEGSHGFPLLKKPYSIAGLMDALGQNRTGGADEG